MYQSLVSIVSQIPNLHLLQTKVMGEDISACNLFPVYVGPVNKSIFLLVLLVL